MDNNRLVLGTAQLGMSYGIANRTGQPDQQEANAIIRSAWECGIREFDTAQGYGESEKVLGAAFHSLGIEKQAKVITKLSFGANRDFTEVVQQAVKESLARLGVQRLHGIMLHDEALLDEWNNGLGDIMRHCIDEGFADNIGVSVYSPDRALQAIDTEGISMIQIPANLLDRRFEKAGVFEKAGEAGKQIYIRSVFLQGVLLMAPDDLPEKMNYVSAVLQQVEMLSGEMGLSRQQLALGFIKAAYPDARVVIGVETREQVSENVSFWGVDLTPEQVTEIVDTFQDINEEILNPSLWPA